MAFIEVSRLKTYNWDNAIHGARAAMESWDRQDSEVSWTREQGEIPSLGENDHKLMFDLARKGASHRKYLREIQVTMCIKAPWLFWKEYETYQIGTTELSTSTMHKMGSRLLELQDFVITKSSDAFNSLLSDLNSLISSWQKLNKFISSLEDKIKEGEIVEDEIINKAKVDVQEVWRTIIELIPGAYIYERTVSLNYEVLIKMFHDRRGHKVVEWRMFLTYLMENIPYPELFTLSRKKIVLDLNI